MTSFKANSCSANKGVCVCLFTALKHIHSDSVRTVYLALNWEKKTMWKEAKTLFNKPMRKKTTVRPHHTTHMRVYGGTYTHTHKHPWHGAPERLEACTERAERQRN